MGTLAEGIPPEIHSQYIQDERKCCQYGYSTEKEEIGAGKMTIEILLTLQVVLQFLTLWFVLGIFLFGIRRLK